MTQKLIYPISTWIKEYSEKEAEIVKDIDYLVKVEGKLGKVGHENALLNEIRLAKERLRTIRTALWEGEYP